MITLDPRTPLVLLTARVVGPLAALAEALDAARELAAHWRSRGKEPPALHRIDVLDDSMDAAGIPGGRR